jgi:hypothetical protein
MLYLSFVPLNIYFLLLFIQAITSCSLFIYFVFSPFNFREYGELLVRFGLIGEAVKIFEDLELWDNVIYCYRYVDTWHQYPSQFP